MAVGKLTGPKKAAILLLALGEEGAAEFQRVFGGINRASVSPSGGEQRKYRQHFTGE